MNITPKEVYLWINKWNFVCKILEILNLMGLERNMGSKIGRNIAIYKRSMTTESLNIKTNLGKNHES